MICIIAFLELKRHIICVNSKHTEMKAVNPMLRCMAFLASILILLQSCTVYHASTSSVDQAISSQSKVKVKVVDDDPYIFKRLERHDANVYGVVNVNSTTFKRLRNQVSDPNYEKKSALVLLNEQDLKNIHEKNSGLSTAINIAVPVVVIGIAAGVAASNVSVDPGWSGI